MLKVLRRMLVVFALLLILLLWLGNFLLERFMDSPSAIPGGGIYYQVQRGSSLSAVTSWLQQNNYLPRAKLLMLYCRVHGCGKKIHRGEYLFTSQETPRSMVDRLERGDVLSYQLTFVEGWSVAQLITAIRSQDKLSGNDDLSRELLMQKLEFNEQYPSLEGLFFPDTYRFTKGDSSYDVLAQASRRLQAVLAEEWSQRDQGLPYKTPYEALIMASLIEKETGVPRERQEIAGVFVRRLQKGMRLQTDPTVIYGLGEGFDGNLRSRHLRDSSNPYNTYRHAGLPPGPIALVGRAAIYAALHPVEGESLYFVARGDGSHYFSATLEEHNKAVEQYQKKQRRSDYRSAPPLNSK